MGDVNKGQVRVLIFLDTRYKANSMIIPQPLSLGDTIGIVAPAGPSDPDKLNRGSELIREMGYKTILPKFSGDSGGYLSAPDEIRARQLNRYFNDPSIKAVLCARGGYGSSRILNRIDYAAVKKYPKLFIGFSDITFLHSAIYKKCGLVTFHGPLATTLASSDRLSKDAFQRILNFPGDPLLPLDGCRVVSSGRASGPIIGGNLTCLCHLMGTAYQPDSRGHLLFLEDKGEAVYRIDRMFTHLQSAGFLDHISGLILGSFESCGPYEQVIDIADEICCKKKIPVIAGFGAGHGKRNLTLPFGLPAVLDTEACSLRFD